LNRLVFIGLWLSVNYAVHSKVKYWDSENWKIFWAWKGERKIYGWDDWFCEWDPSIHRDTQSIDSDKRKGRHWCLGYLRPQNGMRKIQVVEITHVQHLINCTLVSWYLIYKFKFLMLLYFYFTVFLSWSFSISLSPFFHYIVLYFNHFFYLHFCIRNFFDTN